jgi:hypothetical protein
VILWNTFRITCDKSGLIGFFKELLLNRVLIVSKVNKITNTVKCSSVALASFIIHMHTDTRNIETVLMMHSYFTVLMLEVLCFHINCIAFIFLYAFPHKAFQAGECWNKSWSLCTKVSSMLCRYTGHFIMFSMITNNCNKKTKRPTLMEFFTATGKLKKFFRQLDMFDVYTTGDTAHIDTIFKFLPHTHQHVDACVSKKRFQFSCGCEKFH